ncbi:MAG: nucleotidyl transferase AbiEii/AbiGii toxin family protein [Proteobacteria bacterium]|nr:nucleotidyl transferase AbiEii/AbiGii toxin family protein [Pseudomonadota bacterium]
MKKIYLNISNKIDETTLHMYELVNNVATAHDIPFFIIGASARDLILLYGYGLKNQRITKDIDIAIQVSTWQEFDKLKHAFIQTGRFKSTSTNHRLVNTDYNLPLDIIPFGEIEEKNHKITWPSGHENKMTVIGFKEAFKNSLLIRLRMDPELDIPVVSLQFMVVLKLVAWSERSPQGKKDGIDLAYIIKNYLNAGNKEQILSGEHSDLLDDNFDFEISGARLLGRHISEVISLEAKKFLINLLTYEIENNNQNKLCEDMTVFNNPDQYEKNLALLKALSIGLNEK